jgi:hypothetical protein
MDYIFTLTSVRGLRMIRIDYSYLIHFAEFKTAIEISLYGVKDANLYCMQGKIYGFIIS